MSVTYLITAWCDIVLVQITDLATCTKAVAAMGYTATHNASLSGPLHPYGCVVRAWPPINQFFFNPDLGQKRLQGPHGEDCAVVCKANQGSAAATNAVAAIAAPPPSLLPAHIVVSTNVQKFRLDGFMFKSQRTSNRTAGTTTIEDTCAVRVQSHAVDTQDNTGPLDLHVDWLFYDMAYNGSACGIQLLGLGPKDVAQFGYIDMGLDVADSAEATVLVDFMTGGRLQVRGNEGKLRSGFLGIKMFAGLAIDYDVVISGPQDLAIGYLCESDTSKYYLVRPVASHRFRV